MTKGKKQVQYIIIVKGFIKFYIYIYIYIYISNPTSFCYQSIIEIATILNFPESGITIELDYYKQEGCC